MKEARPMRQVHIGGRPLLEFRDKELLPTLQLFAGVAVDAVEGYTDTMGELDLAVGEVLLEPNRTNQYLYLIISGQLQVHLQAVDATPLVTLEPGECVGELSIIDNRVTSAYVVAAVPTRLLVIDQETLWRLINNAPGVARNLLHVLAKRLRSDDHLIVGAIEAKRMWEQHAMVDALTGLHNRRWLQNTLDRLMERARRDGEALSLLMADLDHFKGFNDRFGHLAGDRLLTATAHALQASLRPNDTAARFGGEEFVIVLPTTALEEALEIAERLRTAVGGVTVDDDDGTALPPVTVSVGVAEMHGDMDSAFLLNAADAALYRAKAQGRNRVAT
ncbi:MAG: GGDEF domain-containing protein [Gammaproteobacteria bacterium HGW-Gammaproteobacteria-1]|jgi:diguanylate cyclase (GGDEF)-like protein|nr:MAG: GGDEF domain-containing protein [Gammaproteobacteria bacterium HGW-Gammaproteobacteria-1]